MKSPRHFSRFTSLLLLALGTGVTAQSAIRDLPGFRVNTLPRNDDGSTGLVPIGFPVNFFGVMRSQLYVNNNGNVTFDTPLSTFTPFGLAATSTPIIAVFFADVDTRTPSPGVVTYGQDTVDGHRAFGVNYIDVGYFPTRIDKLNSFQLILIDRSDIAPGNFDIEFNYDKIQWETGGASGGVNGLGGTPAAVGYSNGSRSAGTFSELPGSRVPGSFLDSGPLSLARTSLNSGGIPGRITILTRGGTPNPTISSLSPTSAAVGGLQFTLTVMGTGFLSSSRVRFDNTDLVTTFVSDSRLTAIVPQNLIATAGSANITVANGGITSNLFPFPISGTDGQPMITTACPLPFATLNAPYFQSLEATMGTLPYRFSVDNPQSLPPGIVPPGTTNAAISGTPTAAGLFNFTLRVRDNVSGTSTKSCSIVVLSVPLALTTACPLPPVVVGRPYLQPLEAAGGVAPYVFSVTGTLPAGIVPPGTNSAVISGSSTSLGTFPFTLRVTDATGASVAKDCSVSVGAPPLPPEQPASVLGCPASTGMVGTPYLQTVATFGGSGINVVSLGGALPPGLALDNNSIRGTPTAAGTFGFTLLLGTASRSCSITISPNPVVLSGGCPLPNGSVGVDYPGQTLSATGGTAPYTFSAFGLPGVAVAGNRISGRPTTAGTFTVTLRVSDAQGLSFGQNCAVTVTIVPLTIASVSAPAGTVGLNYSLNVNASGGVPPYSFSASGLPPGLSISSTGVITGTPTTEGTFPVSFQATDSRGERASSSASIVINPRPGPALAITTACPLPDGRVGQPYSQALAATGGTPPYTFSATGLPTGLGIASGGSISGTPSTTGLSSFALQVSDSAGATSTRPCSITIAPALPSVTGLGGTDPNITATGGDVTITVTGTDFTPDSVVQLNGVDLATTFLSSTQLQAVVPAALAGTPGSGVVTVRGPGGISNRLTVPVNLPPFPALRLSDQPATPIAPAQQPVPGVELDRAFPFPIQGTVTVSVTPETGSTDAAINRADPRVRFANGQTSIAFTIPANTTRINLPALASTGTVASAINFTLSNLQSQGQNVTPVPAPRTIRVNRAVPTITDACVRAAGSGFEVQITGFSTTRTLTQAAFVFAPASGANLQTSSATVDLTSTSAAFYRSDASLATGGAFDFRVPFNLQGDFNTIGSVSLTLSNSEGASPSRQAPRCQ